APPLEGLGPRADARRCRPAHRRDGRSSVRGSLGTDLRDRRRRARDPAPGPGGPGRHLGAGPVPVRPRARPTRWGGDPSGHRARPDRVRGRRLDLSCAGAPPPVPPAAPAARRGSARRRIRRRTGYRPGGRALAPRRGSVGPAPARPGAAGGSVRTRDADRKHQEDRDRRRGPLAMTLTHVEVGELSDLIIAEIERAVIGKRNVLEMILLGMLSDGHVLIDDVPGLAKTLMARSFASVLGLGFGRVQFTPDLVPSDITGATIYDQHRGAFEFRRGPVFTNVLLADEINRAPAKTQAALLEAMEERQVTIEGDTDPLQPPFLVLATQNPIEFEGTYPLPEAQLDRFLMRIGVGYPTNDDEWRIIERRLQRKTDVVQLTPVVGPSDLEQMKASVEDVFVSEAIGRYIVSI